jgi:hypothetical protein
MADPRPAAERPERTPTSHAVHHRLDSLDRRKREQEEAHSLIVLSADADASKLRCARFHDSDRIESTWYSAAERPERTPTSHAVHHRLDSLDRRKREQEEEEEKGQE